MTKEEIVKMFLNTVGEVEPEKLDEYIEEIKKNSHSS
ncbi:NADH dehydrogenase [Bacillus cereus]|uniref:NADH dehydrogenase n=1 Tax=Bacillus cereus TaxID=1396 RepID=A0A1S9V709_BACCE|nr:NADH dehydrogenase [Bacillus cereus]